MHPRKLKQLKILPCIHGATILMCVLMLLQASKNFCESLIRKSFKEGFQRLGGPPKVVTSDDVYLAICKNSDFSMFTNFGLGKTLKEERS